VDLIKARQEVTDGKPQTAFVVSRVIRRTLLGNEVSGALAEYGLPVLESVIAQRQIYPRTASGGLTVFDSENNKEAAAEISAVADEVGSIFALGKVKRHVA
jgi:chromosome partitioning protein